MIRRTIGRVLLWFTSAARPVSINFMSREECQTLETAAPDKTSCAGTPFLHDSGPISVQLPPPSLAAFIDVYAVPTPASAKRGEYPSARRIAAILQLRAELDRHERALRVMALGTPDIQSSRIVGALHDVQQAADRVRYRLRMAKAKPASEKAEVDVEALVPLLQREIIALRDRCRRLNKPGPSCR